LKTIVIAFIVIAPLEIIYSNCNIRIGAKMKIEEFRTVVAATNSVVARSDARPRLTATKSGIRGSDLMFYVDHHT
jgi:hypothetical protein